MYLTIIEQVMPFDIINPSRLGNIILHLTDQIHP